MNSSTRAILGLLGTQTKTLKNPTLMLSRKLFPGAAAARAARRGGASAARSLGARFAAEHLVPKVEGTGFRVYRFEIEDFPPKGKSCWGAGLERI